MEGVTDPRGHDGARAARRGVPGTTMLRRRGPRRGLWLGLFAVAALAPAGCREKHKTVVGDGPYAKQVADQIKIPAVAIAGITETNVDEVSATGICAIAVTASITASDDPRAAAERLKKKLVKM